MNHNFVPDCDLSNPAANGGECGADLNVNFGTPVIATRWDDSRLTKNRPYAWQYTAAVQQEVRPGTAVSVNYFRTSWNNFQVTKNLATSASDFSSYCVTLPADSRLPGGGGNSLCGLYNLNPHRVGQVNNLVTSASTFGKQTEVFDGLDFPINSRLPCGSFVGGGVSVGRTATNRCFANTQPQLSVTAYTGSVLVNNPTEFCSVKPPFWRPQLKISGAYQLPWQHLQASASWQNLPGLPITASYVATNAQVAPTLGRPLSGGATSVTIANIIQPYTMFDGWLNQLAARLTRTFTVGRARLQAQFDVYTAIIFFVIRRPERKDRREKSRFLRFYGASDS